MNLMATYYTLKPTVQDLPGIVALYRAVAAKEGGLARTQAEITQDYVRQNFELSQQRGLSLIIKEEESIVGEIHAYRPVPQVFAHVLSDLTVAVHPSQQGKGVGRALFGAFLNEVREHHPQILRVELIARESNLRARALYQSLGFSEEGCLRGRIRSATGGFEADIPMAWLRAERSEGRE
ncbi:MAG: GNAT family N-acetyltransferase [Deltaproteobacteria bacterium]|nr:GNAT family N-acetyltransferase [Deltaproteobacteria bacterium]